jgi:hypothetical protein
MSFYQHTTKLRSHTSTEICENFQIFNTLYGKNLGNKTFLELGPFLEESSQNAAADFFGRLYFFEFCGRRIGQLGTLTLVHQLCCVSCGSACTAGGTGSWAPAASSTSSSARRRTGRCRASTTGSTSTSSSRKTRQFCCFFMSRAKIFTIHCKKRLSIFPSPAGMSLTKLFPRQEEFGK